MVALVDDGRDRSWMDDAACRNHPNPDLWYPDTSNLFDPRVREAGRICSTCPVRNDCYIFGSKERHGIYGGVLMSTKKRIPVEQVKPVPYRQQQPAKQPASAPAAKQSAPAPAAGPAQPATPEPRLGQVAAATRTTTAVAESVVPPALEPVTTVEPGAVSAPTAEQRNIIRNILGFFGRLLRP